VNKDLRSWKEPLVELTAEESALLLNGVEKNELPARIVTAFQGTDLLEDPAMLARNLRSVLVSTTQ
jgi:hypothetical protein